MVQQSLSPDTMQRRAQGSALDRAAAKVKQMTGLLQQLTAAGQDQIARAAQKTLRPKKTLTCSLSAGVLSDIFENSASPAADQPLQNVQAPSLDAIEMQDILCGLVVPKLPLQSLGALASTCKALRSAIYSLDQTWLEAAREYLPQSFGYLHRPSRAEVQQQLQQHSTAVANLLAGRVTGSVDLQGVVRNPILAEFSPDGRQVAVLGHHNALLLFDTSTGSRAGSITLTQLPIPMLSSSVQWTPDGKHLVGMWQYKHSCSTTYQIFEVDVRNGAQPTVWQWRIPREPPKLCARRASFSACRRWFAASVMTYETPYWGCVVVSMETRTTLMSVSQKRPGLDLCWSPSNPILAACGALMQLHNGTWQLTADIAALDNADQAEFSPDGRMLAVSMQHPCSSPSGCLDLATLAMTHEFPKGMQFLSFLGRGEAVLLHTRWAVGGHFRVWDVCVGAPMCTLEYDFSRRRLNNPIWSALDRVIILDAPHSKNDKMRTVSAFDARTGLATLQMPDIKGVPKCTGWHPLLSMLISCTPVGAQPCSITQFSNAAQQGPYTFSNAAQQGPYTFKLTRFA